jgi:hypothetical protein
MFVGIHRLRLLRCSAGTRRSLSDFAVKTVRGGRLQVT